MKINRLLKTLGLVSVILLLTIKNGPIYAQPAQTNNYGPVIVNGLAQIAPHFNDPKKWIKHELWVETEFDSDDDGKKDRMHVFVTRPYQTDTYDLKLPAIYISSPYFGGHGGNSKKYFWDVAHELGETPPKHQSPNVKTKKRRPMDAFIHDRTWVPRGYCMVYSESPGTGQSDGAPTVGGENESLAPKTVIEWLNGKAKGFTTRSGNEEVTAYWCTGNVGMTGTSYNGTLCLAAASTGVEGLKAIIPIAPVTSFYHYYRSNGLVRSPGGYLGEDIDVLYDFVNSGDVKKRKRNDKVVRDQILVKGQDRITGDYNSFWESRDYLDDLDNMKAALLLSHGFNDWNVMPEQTARVYAKFKDAGIPIQLYYHQGGHGGPPPITMTNKWFTKYLFEIDNGVEDDPKVAIVREHQKYPEAYEDYPHPNAKDVKLYLSPGNPERGGLTLEKNSSGKTERLIDNAEIKGKELAQASSSTHRLLYLTAPLQKEIHISGTPKIEITLSSSAPAANLSVWLVSLPWDGTAIYDNVITRGWADPQNYKSLSKGEKLEPRKYYTMQFDLNPDDQVIRKGQQIGLLIFSSDNEFTLHPKPGTEITIDLDSTTLILPVVGGVEDLKESIENK